MTYTPPLEENTAFYEGEKGSLQDWGFTIGSMYNVIVEGDNALMDGEKQVCNSVRIQVNVHHKETGATTMQLHERLEICLLALANRYTDHVVDIDEEVLGPQSLGAEGWTSRDMIDFLRLTNPALLDAQADLIIDPQESVIYLPTYSAQTPALHIHCRGKLPPLKGNVESRQLALKQPHVVLR